MKKKRKKKKAKKRVLKNKPVQTDSDQIKMSTVILKITDPLLKKYSGDEKRVRAIISLATIAWNISMYPPDEQEKKRDVFMDKLLPSDGKAEDVGHTVYMLDLFIERIEKHFPNVKCLIPKYNLIVSGRT